MHYRLFMSSEWFTAADLYDEKADQLLEVALTIARVTKGNLIGQKGRKSNKPALHFVEKKPDGSDYRPLGCCVENSAAVSNIAGSENPRDWVGKRITLYVKMIEDRETKGRRPAVRIKPFAESQQRAARPQQQSRPAPQQAGDREQGRIAAAYEKNTKPPAPSRQSDPMAPDEEELALIAARERE